MYKVLIVDDEKIVRVALRSMIDWQAEGFEICDAVANGEQGLQTIETHRPQLIIADIRMPKMDGMAFSAKAREMGFTGEIIILSNHKKFSYAVEALHHNVLDYLCKTDITPETLLKIVRKARLKLQAAPAVQTAALPSEADLDRLEQHWADPALPPATLSQGYMAVLVRARRAGGSEQAARSALKNLLPELGRHWFSRALQCSEGKVLCLLSAEQAAQYEQNAAQLCARLTQLADLYMNTEAVLVHSPQFHTTDSFLQMVEQCRQACALTMYFGFGRPIACTLLESYDQLLEDAGSWLRQTHRAAIQPAAGRLRACIQQLFASLRGRRVPPAPAGGIFCGSAQAVSGRLLSVDRPASAGAPRGGQPAGAGGHAGRIPGCLSGAGRLHRIALPLHHAGSEQGRGGRYRPSGGGDAVRKDHPFTDRPAHQHQRELYQPAVQKRHRHQSHHLYQYPQDGEGAGPSVRYRDER